MNNTRREALDKYCTATPEEVRRALGVLPQDIRLELLRMSAGVKVALDECHAIDGDDPDRVMFDRELCKRREAAYLRYLDALNVSDAAQEAKLALPLHIIRRLNMGINCID